MAAIRNALDCGVDFPRSSSHSYAEALITFLQALPKPIIPTDMIPAIDIDAHAMKSWCRRFLETLPPLNYNVLVYVLSFLREVLQVSEFNRSSASKLSLLCVTCMTTLAIQLDESALSKEDKAKREQRQIVAQKIVEFMLTTTSL